VETFTSKISFVRKAFGEVTLARDGVNVAAKCPNCKSSSKRKFSINLETWGCHCWVCGIKGKNLRSILFKYVGNDFAYEYSDRFLSKSHKNKMSEEIEDKVSLPRDFIPLFLNFSPSDPDIKDCMRYLVSRGINKRDIWYFKLGTCEKGSYRRRIIVPSFDSDGILNYFSARSIDESSGFKYLNSKAKKTDIIFNELNIDWKSELTLVEGPFDLFKCNQNSTCLLGSNLRKDSYLFKKIASNRTPVLLALDSDMKKKSAKIADLLSSYDCQVRIADLKGYSDVGEMRRSDFAKAMSCAKLWSRESSLMQKISSIQTGSLI
jgi:DNA primase